MRCWEECGRRHGRRYLTIEDRVVVDCSRRSGGGSKINATSKRCWHQLIGREDVNRMAKDVDATLTAIIRRYGSMSEDNAHDYKRELVSAKRYVRDVY